MTTTTHKSLRGPRGGMILCKKQHASAIDKSVFPGMQGGPHMHQIAAIATTLKLAATEDFKSYCKNVLANAQVLAKNLVAGGAHLVTGGTENHLIVVDTTKGFNMTGDVAEKALDMAGITLNKNVIPDDPNPPMKPSGIRFGTPAATARGMGEAEMKQLGEAALYHATLRIAICARFPVPGLTSESKAKAAA